MPTVYSTITTQVSKLQPHDPMVNAWQLSHCTLFTVQPALLRCSKHSLKKKKTISFSRNSSQITRYNFRSVLYSAHRTKGLLDFRRPAAELVRQSSPSSSSTSSWHSSSGAPWPPGPPPPPPPRLQPPPPPPPPLNWTRPLSMRSKSCWPETTTKKRRGNRLRECCRDGGKQKQKKEEGSRGI